jgi:hypothetical protein
MPGVPGLPADAQHTRRRPSAPHADITSICGFNLHLTARLRRVSSRFVESDESSSLHGQAACRTQTARVRQCFAVRATGRAGCRITRPQLRSRVSTLMAGRVGDAHVVPHIMRLANHSHTPGPDVTVSGCFGPHMRLVL